MRAWPSLTSINPSTLIGILVGLLTLFSVLVFAAEEPLAFVNLPGLAIVLGGTLAATLISYPLREVLKVSRLVSIVFRNERMYSVDDIEELVRLARIWSRGDIRSVERELAKAKNPYLRTGVQLIIDGAPLSEILDLLQWRIMRLKARENAEAQVFRTMASFAPAFGMIGTLVGLINMMFILGDGDLVTIGQQMGVALLTTFYGILLANLIFKPVAVKLERRTEQRVTLMNMVLEGVTLMAKKRNPTLIRETLKSFVAHFPDELRDPNAEPEVP